VHASIGAGNAQRLLRGAKAVVDALDNAQSRLVVRDACAALRITALHAGLGPDGYVDVRNNEGYRIEAPSEGQMPCRSATTRSQVLLAVTLTAEAVRLVLEGGLMSNRAACLAAFLESAQTL
jgi:hypothetical protein